MAVQDDGFLSRIVPSNIGSGVKYCSQECASKAWQSLDYDDFIAHAKSENEAFVMAGQKLLDLNLLSLIDPPFADTCTLRISQSCG